MRELFGSDEAVKFALAANIGYYHDDPERMLFLRYAIPQASYLAGGGHYVRGGSPALTDRLVALIKEAGGTIGIRPRSRPFAVCRRQNRWRRPPARAAAAMSREEAATMIFGNAAPQVLAAMLPEDRQSAFLRRTQSPIIEFVVDDIARGKSADHASAVSATTPPSLFPTGCTASQMREASALMADAPRGRVPYYVLVDF